ncbi:hypothetical protein [Streptomyces sp. NPDC000618]|uniref:hypothetical protein n=1 Tax=Streptomyces sp. NPDC000618 TaxID=3154265 RepID=UPI00331EE175
MAALIGGAAFVGTDDGDGDSRSATSMPGGGLPDNARGAGPDASAPSGSGSASASTAPSASPSPGATSASPKASATGSAKNAGAGAPTQAGPSTGQDADTDTDSGAGTDVAAAGAGGSDGPSCTSAAGSGPLTDYSACVSSGTVTFKVTFHSAKPFYHVFIDTDGNTRTGYQLPYPSPSALGADYMIENGGLFRSRSTDWSWTETSAHPTRTVSGGTQTWVLPLSKIGSPSRTQRVEFHAGSDYTAVITFNPA